MNRSLALLVAIVCAGCGAGRADWPLPNGDAAGTRAAHSAAIDAHDVARLHVAWRFRLPGPPGDSGVATATPVVADGVVYEQDMQSDVFALRARDGRLLWAHLFHAGTPGPNGLAVDGSAVYGSTDTTVFALDAHDGRMRWARRILGPRESYVDVAPLASHGVVYTATTGYGPGTRGAIYALDERSGRIRWRFDTIRGRWAHPRVAGGGGAWQTPTLGGGTLYVGTANPLPWGGSPALPNGGAYAGPARWTDSLLALDARSGRLRWFDQVTPHDVRDHDFQDPPVLDGGLVVGAGKAGLVLAWDARSHRRRWVARVGLHRNDEGPLPRREVSVCPGLLGGVETPVAVAGGRVFAASVDLCYGESATGAATSAFTAVDPAAGRGVLVALDEHSGRRLWSRLLPSPPFGCTTVSNDVVFVPTYDGRITAYRASDGRPLWQARASAGINACPAVAGKQLLVAAGVRNRSFTKPQYELVAYSE
ncbi:MAG TPA: PQQ-binding-like beta-propeller repeat protein [Gaiellaceae bacterium]|nr:PQQ-binding-like beta-propeller repeat protein [Gaiellaceae bacterium]